MMNWAVITNDCLYTQNRHNQTLCATSWKNTPPLIKCSCQKFDPESDQASGFNKHITGNRKQRNTWNSTMRMHSTKPSLWEVAEQTTMFVHQINCTEGNRMVFVWIWADNKTNKTKAKQCDRWRNLNIDWVFHDIETFLLNFRCDTGIVFMF